MSKRLTESGPSSHEGSTLENARLGTTTELGERGYYENVELGDYSYTGPFCFLQNAVVGKFANIAAAVRIGPTLHPMDRPTLHHFTYRPGHLRPGRRGRRGFLRLAGRQVANVGHDTWIGHGAIIMPGVEVGDGAVVGSGAVVTQGRAALRGRRRRPCPRGQGPLPGGPGRGDGADRLVGLAPRDPARAARRLPRAPRTSSRALRRRAPRVSRACCAREGLAKTFTVHQLGKRIRACEGVTIDVAAGRVRRHHRAIGLGQVDGPQAHLPQLPSPGGQRPLRLGALRARSTSSARPNAQIIYLRRREIGYVSQFLDLLPRTTARETRRAGGPRGRAWRPRPRAEEAERLLAHFELDEELCDSYASTFSGGEKLRLNIARAMVKQPRLLLLDEPTASLDEHSKGKVRELIEKLKAEGTTMLGIFHDLEFMEGLCDREYRMSQGSLSEGRP